MPDTAEIQIAAPEKQRRQSARSNILFAFAVVIGLAILWRLRSTLLLLYVSALFATVLMPVVQSIRDFEMRGGRRISRGLAIAMLLGCVVLALVIFFVVAVPPVLHDIRQFAADLPQRIPKLIARLQRFPLARRLGVQEMADRAESALSSTAAFVLASFPKWLGGLFDIVTALVLCVYFMLEGEFAYRWALSLFPAENRRRLDATLQRAEIRISKWLLGQGLLMLILGVCSTTVFGFLHVRYFVLLGVLMGLMNLIPIAGGVITITLAAGVAALDSWSKMAGVLIFYAIYINIENAVLTPRIMKSSVNLMGLTVLISLIAGTEIAGIVGALVAVPTAGLIAVLLDEYVVQGRPSTEEEKVAKELSNKLPQ